MKAFDIYKRAMRLLGYGDILNDEALRQRFCALRKFPLYPMSLKPMRGSLKRLPAALQCLYP